MNKTNINKKKERIKAYNLKHLHVRCSSIMAAAGIVIGMDSCPNDWRKRIIQLKPSDKREERALMRSEIGEKRFYTPAHIIKWLNKGSEVRYKNEETKIKLGPKKKQTQGDLPLWTPEKRSISPILIGKFRY